MRVDCSFRGLARNVRGELGQSWIEIKAGGGFTGLVVFLGLRDLSGWGEERLSRGGRLKMQDIEGKIRKERRCRRGREQNL